MAIFHMDNFNIYGTNTALMSQGIYAIAGGTTGGSGFSLVADPDGVSTQRVLRMNTAGDSWRYVLAATQNTVGLACRIYLQALNTNNFVRPMQVFDGASSTMAYFAVDSTGRIGLYKGDGTQLAITAGPVVTAGSWWHIEGKMTSGAPGACAAELRVEGVVVLTASGLTFSSNSPTYSVGASGVNTGVTQTFYTKDLVCWDTTGAQNNDFLGSCLVNNIVPNSDVALNWTPSVGANGYSLLSQIPPNDAQYISAPFPFPPGNYECTFTSLPNTPFISSVKAVLTRARAVKSDGGDGSLQVSLKSAAALANGANRPITTSLTYWSDVQELDPNTTLAWTPGSVNSVHGVLARTA